MTTDFLAISELLLSAFAAVLQDQKAIYCSGAITSGERALDWLHIEGLTVRSLDEMPSDLRVRFEREVISANLTDLAHFTQTTKEHSGLPCINPGALQNIEMWEQSDWHQFWCTVIKRFATAVALGPGWSFSTGACIEVKFAVLQGIKLLNQFAEPVSVSEVLDQMQSSVTAMQKYGISTKRFEDVIANLNEHKDK